MNLARESSWTISSGAARPTEPAESLSDLSTRTPAMRWEGLQETLRNAHLSPAERETLAGQQLALALEHFSERDERLARAHHCMARAIVRTDAAAEWPIYEHTRDAIRIYQQVEKKSRQFNPEQLAGELEIIDLFRDNIATSDIANLVAASFKNALALLPKYIEQQKESFGAKFQCLQVCQEAANFYLYHHEDPLSSITRAVKAACKVAGLHKPKNLEALEQVFGWRELPSAFSAQIWGSMVEYYNALGDGFRGDVIRCAENQVDLLKSALQSQEHTPQTAAFTPLYGEETSLINEMRRSLVDALNTLGNEQDRENNIDHAQTAYVEALSVPIPATGRYYRKSLEGLHSLADQYVEIGCFREAAWIHDMLATNYLILGRATIAAEHVSTACKIYGHLQQHQNALESIETALDLLAQHNNIEDPQVRASQARLLWARDGIEQQLSPELRATEDQRQEHLKTILATCRRYVFENSAQIHLYALTCAIEPLLDQEQEEQSRTLLLEAFELLGGEEGQPEGFEADQLPKACWSVGHMLVAHSDELSGLGEIILRRGIDQLDNAESTTSKDYFPYLATLAEMSATYERDQEEGIEYVERALHLFPEPNERSLATAQIIVGLMEMKSVLLEQLGRFSDVAEYNLEIADFRRRFDLDDDDED